MKELPTKVIPRKLHLYHINQNQTNGDDATLLVWAADIREAAEIYLTTAAMYEWDLENTRYKDNASVTGVMHNTVRLPLQRPPHARALDWEPIMNAARMEALNELNRAEDARIEEMIR